MLYVHGAAVYKIRHIGGRPKSQLGNRVGALFRKNSAWAQYKQFLSYEVLIIFAHSKIKYQINENNNALKSFSKFSL